VAHRRTDATVALDIRSSDTFTVSLFIAAALHAVLILGLGFVSFTSAISAPPSLEVILVQDRDGEEPDEADYLAQVSRDGGGQREDNTRPASPFASERDFETDGVAPTPVVASAPAPTESAVEEVITATFAEREIRQENDASPTATVAEREDPLVVEQNLDIARLAAEIDRQQEEFAKRPKKKFINARTREASSAEYMKHWVETVERVGNLNYPDAARRNELSGALILTVGIRKNGDIESVTVDRSSTQTVLDDAARRIVELSGPFEPLRGKLAEQADIIYITRTWEFRGDDSLTTY